MESLGPVLACSGIVFAFYSYYSVQLVGVITDVLDIL
jgi:hypothetical protein